MRYLLRNFRFWAGYRIKRGILTKSINIRARWMYIISQKYSVLSPATYVLPSSGFPLKTWKQCTWKLFTYFDPCLFRKCNAFRFVVPILVFSNRNLIKSLLQDGSIQSICIRKMLRYTQEQPSFFFFFIKYKEFNIYFLFVLGIVQKWSMLAISAMVKKWPDLVCFYPFSRIVLLLGRAKQQGPHSNWNRFTLL
jgi:hypothetical protein